MATFEMQLAKSRLLDENTVANELFAFIKSIEAELIDLNKKQISEKHEDIYGRAIGFYSKATEFISGGQKRAGQPFTGIDTGDWMRGWYMAQAGQTFYFGSTDPKTDDILDSPHWLSHDLFGLSEDTLWVVIHTKFKPFIISHYRKTLDL